MKKLLILFVAVATASLTFTSCSKDSAAAPSIVGKWAYSKSGTIVSGQEVLQDHNHAATCTKDHMEFLAGGTFTDKSYSGSSCDESTASGTWTKSGSTFTVTFDQQPPIVTTIASLTSTALKLTFTDSGTTYIITFTRM